MSLGFNPRGAALAGCLAAAFTVGAADDMRVVLKNGAELAGHLLRQRDDAVMIDLGFTVLSVPRVEIARLDKISAAPKVAAANSTRGEDIYFVEPSREPMPVEKMSSMWRRPWCRSRLPLA